MTAKGQADRIPRTFFSQLSSTSVAVMMPVAVLLVISSLVTVASGKSFAATSVGQGPSRYDEFGRDSPPNHYLLHNAGDLSMGTLTQSDDEQRANSVHNTRESVQRAEENEYREQPQSSEFQESEYSQIERLGTDKKQFQKMIRILRNQIRKSGRNTSDFTKIIEGIVSKCASRPDRWCRDVALVLVDMVHDDERDGISMNTASRHREKRSAIESRGYSDVDRFINLHDRFLRDDFSHMTPAEWDAHQKISQDQQSITQYVFKELQNLLYKSRHELQDKSKEVQIFNPFQKTTPATPVLKPVTFADISEEIPYLRGDDHFPSNLSRDNRPSLSFDTGYTFSPTVVYNEPIAAKQDEKENTEETTAVQMPAMIANTPKEITDRQKVEYFSPNLDTDNRQPVSFSTGYTFSPTVVYDEPIAAEQGSKEDLEDFRDLSDASTKYFGIVSSTTVESPSTDTSRTHFVINSIFDGGLFLTNEAALNMSPSQGSPTSTTPSEPVPMKISSTPTQITETFPTPGTATQEISPETRSTYTKANLTTPSEIPSATLSRRTVRLPPSSSLDYEYVSRTSPTFTRTTLSPASMTVRSTPRDVLFRTSVPFTPVPPAQYVDTSDALIHEYHDYVVDYESHITNPSDPNAVPESRLSQQQLEDLSLDSKYYEYYDDGNFPLTVDPNELGASYQPMTVAGSLDSLNSEFDDSNYPLYEYFIISEYPEGGSVSNANDKSSLVSSPDAIFQQADSSDESMRRTVDPLYHLLESVTKPSTVPLNPTSVRNTIRYEILQNENVHGNAKQVPQYISSTQFTPSRRTATPPSISQSHMSMKPPVTHSFTIPAPTQNPFIYQTTPQLVTKVPISDQNQKIPSLHHQYNEPLFNKEFMLQMEVPVKSTPLYITTQKVAESSDDSHLFGSVNTLFQQLTTNPAVDRTTHSPESSNTAQLLKTLQKNLETLAKLQQSQQKSKETTNRPSETVVPFNIDNYKYKVPELSATFQNAADLPDKVEMNKSSLEEKREKPPLRPSLTDILRASMKVDADRLKHQANVFKTVREDNTSASPIPKVQSVTSLFSSIPSTPSNKFVKFQQLSPVTSGTINKPKVNNSFRIASIIPTEASIAIEPTTAEVVPVVLVSSESPSVNTSKTTTAAPPKDENLVFGIPLSIIESEFRLTSSERQKYVSGQHTEKSNTPSGIEKHVTVVNETGEDSTEPVKPEEITVRADASQEKDSESSVAGNGILASILKSELRTVSSEEAINLLDVELNRIRNEINNKAQDYTHHGMGSAPKSQIGFFPQLMATLLAPFRTTTEGSIKSTNSIKGTTQSNLHFTSRAYTQSDVRSTLQALFNPSTEHPQKEKSETNEYLLNDHSRQGSFGKYGGETTENTYMTETIPSISTNAYDTTIPMVVKESSSSASNSTFTEDSDRSSHEDVSLPMTTSDSMTSQTVDFPWLYEDLPSIDVDLMLPEQIATEFSDQPSSSFEATTQELASPTETDPTIWSDETQSLLNLRDETTPALEDLDEGFSFIIAPTSSSLIVADTEPQTDHVEASATEPSGQYGQGYDMEEYSIPDSESTSSYDLRTDKFSVLDEQKAMPSQMISPEQTTTNTLDDYLMATEIGNSTETYESGVTLQQLLHTAKILMAQSTSPSYQADTESEIVSPMDKSTEQPQLETTLTALFLTNSIENDYVYVTTEAMPSNTFTEETYDSDDSTSLPSIFKGDTSTADVASSASSISSSSAVTEIAQGARSSSPGTRTTSAVSTFSDNTNSTTFHFSSTASTPKESTTSSNITTPITPSTTKLATTKSSFSTTSRPASFLLTQLNSLGGHFALLPSWGA